MPKKERKRNGFRFKIKKETASYKVSRNVLTDFVGMHGEQLQSKGIPHTPKF